MQAGGVTAAPAPAPTNGYGAQQQQQQQQQMLLPQHHQQQLSNNSPASTAATGTATTNKILINGGRFDFDDGGTYCGGWEDGKAHGHGVCTGPKGQGAYSGSWHYGFEVSGVYMWPSGNTFEGQWQNGKRHGLGVESRGRWLYRGEWTQGFKGRYGVRQSATTNAKYEGTWANGLQDGYGSETYADGGTFQGQWMRGMRHGYGVRTSARFGMASHSKPNKLDIRNSLSSLGSDDAHNKVGSASEDPVIGSEGRDKKLDDTRGGFVLKANSDEQPNKHKTLVSKSTHSLKRTFMSGFKMRKQRSTGELEKKVSGSIRSTASCTSWISTGSSQSAMGESYNTDSNASFIVEDEHMDVNTTETYVGEWKNDKRSGYGIAERTDGLKYEGEWFANKKYGYGVTTFKDGTKEEGKYKNNVLVTSQKKKNYFLMRSAKLKERIEASVNAAHRASKIALQKADIAISRMATARGKAELSDIAADHAREDYEIAKLTAKQFAPDFIQPGLEKTRLREILKQRMSIDQKSILQPLIPIPNPVGPTSSSDAADASSLSLSTNNLLYSNTGGQQDAAETTPQFRPRSHYAQPYYQSTGSNHLQQQQQQQQQQSGGVNSQSSLGQSYPRNSLTPEMKQNSSNNHHPGHHPPQQNNGYNRNSGGSSAQPPLVPSRPNNNGLVDQYPDNAQNSMYGAGARRPYSQNGSGGGAVGGGGGGPPTARQSMVDRASFSQQRMSSSSYAPYPRANEDDNGGGGGAGWPRRDSVSRPSRPNQYEVGVDDDTDPSLLRRNTKYVNRESLYSFQQAMSDHFDHYKRPPSRDNSVDRYSRAASRLSGGSRQSSVEKSQNQQQQRRVDDRLPPSSSLAFDKLFSNDAGFNVASAAGAKQNISSSAATQRQPQPFEDIILRQRNLGQEIVPSPVGQPKRTESLYVNPNTARKETKPKEVPVQMALQRKKSLPDVQVPLNAPASITREEVSVLSSARREEMRRVEEENERLRANPLLYLVSPHMKDWFTRQQLVLVILIVNISLALMFFKLLTS
ncbi:hypothetical protein QTP88_020669 [Uroleucon formosanum]